MTREELIAKIQDIEWDDFEAKEALNELPMPITFLRCILQYACSTIASVSKILAKLSLIWCTCVTVISRHRAILLY